MHIEIGAKAGDYVIVHRLQERSKTCGAAIQDFKPSVGVLGCTYMCCSHTLAALPQSHLWVPRVALQAAVLLAAMHMHLWGCHCQYGCVALLQRHTLITAAVMQLHLWGPLLTMLHGAAAGTHWLLLRCTSGCPGCRSSNQCPLHCPIRMF